MCPLLHFLEKKIGSICNLSMEAQKVQLITRFKVTNVYLEAKLPFFLLCSFECLSSLEAVFPLFSPF